MPTPPNQNPSFGRTARQDEEDVKTLKKTLAMLTQLHPKTSEVKVFQLRKKKVSMPTQENSWKRSFYGASTELLRRPRFLPQIFKFWRPWGQSLRSKSAVKVCGQSLWSKSVVGIFAGDAKNGLSEGQRYRDYNFCKNTRCFVKMKANVIQLQKY
jgi:hypothetical protein